MELKLKQTWTTDYTSPHCSNVENDLYLEFI